MPRNPERSEAAPLFDLGQLLATPGALDELAQSGDRPEPYVRRHVTGDWSEMAPEDQEQNRAAVREGNRVFSSYALRNGHKLWIITEWDRSVTTLLLPEEY